MLSTTQVSASDDVVADLCPLFIIYEKPRLSLISCGFSVIIAGRAMLPVLPAWIIHCLFYLKQCDLL